MNTKAGALDRLNDALKVAEARIYALNLGAGATIKMTSEVELGWWNHDKKWQLYIYVCSDGMRKARAGIICNPIMEAKAEHRVLAARHLQALLEAIRIASGENLRGIEESISAAQLFADGDL